MKFIEKLEFSLAITFLEQESSTTRFHIWWLLLSLNFSGRPGPRCHGLRCRRPSSDLFPTRRLSTKVFQPSSIALPSVFPALPRVFHATPLLPTQSSFQPYSLPVVFHDFMFSWIRGVLPNPGLSHIQDVSRESRRMSSRAKRVRERGSL